MRAGTEHDLGIYRGGTEHDLGIYWHATAPFFMPSEHFSAIFAILAAQVISFVHRKGRKETPG